MLNERIENIARQCMSMRFFVDTASEEFDYKKFAELIVKECAYLVNHQQRTTGYTAHAKMLCEEFGIEFKEEDFFGVEK